MTDSAVETDEPAPVSRSRLGRALRLTGWVLVAVGVIAYLLIYRWHAPSLAGALALAVAEVGVALIVLYWQPEHRLPVIQLQALGGVGVAAGVAFAAGQIVPQSPLPEPGPTPPPSSSSCQAPSKSFKEAGLVRNNNQLLTLRQMNYDLTYGREGDGAFAYIELAGSVDNPIPARKHLYMFGWADPATKDSYDNPGNGRYVWHPNEWEIFPDPKGCWSLPKFKVGYAGAQGLAFRYHLALVDTTQQPCIDDLMRKDRRGDGLIGGQLQACGIAFLGYAPIPTERASN